MLFSSASAIASWTVRYSMPARIKLPIRPEFPSWMGGTYGARYERTIGVDGRTGSIDSAEPGARPASRRNKGRLWALADRHGRTSGGKCAGSCRGARNGSCQGLVEGDVIHFERSAQRLVKADVGMAVVGQGLYFRAIRAGEVLLIQHNLIGGGGAQSVAFLVGVERLLLEVASLHCGVVSRAGLPQSDDGILYVHPNLIDVLLQAEFILPQLEFAGNVVGLRSTVAQRNIQREPDRIIRKVPPEHLAQKIAVAAGQIVHAGDFRSVRRQHACEPVVGDFREGL